MFSGDFAEIGFIIFIAFLLFGPKKLPEIARVLGKGLGELRRASNELKSSLEEEIRNMDQPPEENSEITLESTASVPALPDQQPEENPEITPPYGHDHAEPSREEPESRP